MKGKKYKVLSLFAGSIWGGVNGKVKVYQFWENKSVPPLGNERELRKEQLA